jgi:hypothetical protein
MINSSNFSKTVISLLVAATLAGCAAQPQNGSPRQAANNNDDPCSVGNSAVAGAAVGALLGAMLDGKKGAMKGAALGGLTAAAGCVAINVQSRQTKTAAQADLEYKQRMRGQLPRDPVVVAYSPQLSSSVVQRGKPFTVTSVVELVNGTAQPVNEVREEIIVLDPRGEPFKQGSKSLANSNHGAGRFENSFELTLPAGVSQGVYGVKTNLYVNGKLAASRDLRTQLVWNGVEGKLVAMR